MKIREGDIVEFIGISWNEPQWEFDFPTVIVKPVIAYSPNGDYCDQMIEDLGIQVMCGEELKDEDVEKEFNWRHWKISTLKRVIRERLEGKDTWKTKIREVIKQKLKFYKNEQGELDYKIIESITK